MSFSLEVNDLFDELSSHLADSRRLINLLLSECKCQQWSQQTISLIKQFKEENVNQINDNKCVNNKNKESIDKHNKKRSFKGSHSKRRVFKNFCQVLEEREVERVEPNANNAYECSQCSAQFSQMCRLRRHLRIHWKPFKCLKCDKTFAQKSNAMNHFLRVHKQYIEELEEEDEKRNSLCLWPGCGKEFTSSATLQRHSMVHSGERPFECDICGKSFSQKSNLSVHILNVHSLTELPVIEPVLEIQQKCNKQFIRDEKGFKCLICFQRFTVFSQLRRHLYTHQTIKPFKCPNQNCDKSFAQKSNLLSHFLRIHSKNSIVVNSCINRKKERISCHKCNKRFSNEKLLNCHLKNNHLEENGFNCEKCEMSFRLRQHLEQHERKHRQTFKCLQCEYSTHLETHLRVHESKHSGKELFNCELCGKGFNFLGQLSTHKQTFHGIKLPLICDWPGCSNAYKTVAGIRKHSTIHTGEERYSCYWPECGQTFRLLATLKIHVVSVHTLERLFECQQCFKKYKTRDHLKTHERQVHRKTK